MFQVPGDLLGHRSVGIAGEAPVQVAAIQRRGALSGDRCREVRGRQDDDPPLDPTRIEGAGEVAQRDLALVFIAVVAGDEQRGGTVAVAQHHDRDRDEPIGGVVDRVKQAQEAGLAAVPREIDFGHDPAAAGCRHIQ